MNSVLELLILSWLEFIHNFIMSLTQFSKHSRVLASAAMLKETSAAMLLAENDNLIAGSSVHTVTC